MLFSGVGAAASAAGALSGALEAAVAPLLELSALGVGAASLPPSLEPPVLEVDPLSDSLEPPEAV